MYEAHGGTDGATKAPPASDPPSPARKAGPLARARRAVLSDDRLAKEAAAGDLGAFEAIFRRYQDDLYRFCVGILREPQDAQDAVQNTMFKAMRALPGERREMQLKPWLYRIAHNEAVELRRRERPAEELVESVDVVAAGTEERAEDKGRLRMLLADIADLPERQRASLVMREVNGLGFGEIGAVLGTSPGAVRQALYEARRGLAEMDHGRDMQCDLATRMVSDADGRPRDRGVRAHLRDCSPCRRFQAEIRGRGRALAAISPLPALAAAGAAKAALGSGAAGGGAGAAAAASGAGAGAGSAGVAAGSLGGAALLKPAVGLLTVLAIGTAAVDHGAIFAAGRHDPVTAGAGESARVLVGPAEGGRPVTSRAVVRHGGGRGGVVAMVVPADNSSPATDANALGGSAPTERRGHAVGLRRVESAARVGGESPALEGTAPAAALPPPPAAQVPAVTSSGDVEHAQGAAPGEAKTEIAPPDQVDEESVPSDQPGADSVPPGQAEQEGVPPGQAKKEAEPAPEPTAGEAAAPAPAQVEVPAKAAPGQVKKEAEAFLETAGGGSPNAAAPTTEAPTAPPGQAKEEEATTE